MKNYCYFNLERMICLNLTVGDFSQYWPGMGILHSRAYDPDCTAVGYNGNTKPPNTPSFNGQPYFYTRFVAAAMVL